MTSPSDAPLARNFDVPQLLDSVLSPTVVYGASDSTALHSLARDEKTFVRIGFEGLDSIRVCRGEYLPYPMAPGEEYNGPGSVYLIDNSAWLRERYAYEAEHYRHSYEWGGSVEEMLTDYEHYLFRFHDEYVEAIARGISFETSRKPFTLDKKAPRWPWDDLPKSRTTERFVIDGITCQVRTSALPLEQLLEEARYCTQPLFHFALELEGSASVSRRVDLRVRRGETRSLYRGIFGPIESTLPGVATLEQAKAFVEPHIREVAEHRRLMGK